MNSQRNLHGRLLKLFPVSFIKSRFGAEGADMNEVIENILDSHSLRGIKTACLSEINRTKQHVRIYQLVDRFSHNSFVPGDFVYDVESTNIADGAFIINCTPIVQYNVYLNNPPEEATVSFMQPTKITIKGRTLIIQTTILEKKIESYFDVNRRVFEDSRRNKETEIVANIMSYFFTEVGVVGNLDLNRGVKHLLDHDVIDCKTVKFKKSRSTSSEAMDEDHTVKNSYEDVYEAMMAAPLKKMVVKYLLHDNLFPKHFSIDPSTGEIGLTLYPEDENQITNVINQILQNN